MRSTIIDAAILTTEFSYCSLAQSRPNKTDGGNGDPSVDLVMLPVRPVTYSDCSHRSGWPSLDKNSSSAERYLQNLLATDYPPLTVFPPQEKPRTYQSHLRLDYSCRYRFRTRKAQP